MSVSIPVRCSACGFQAIYELKDEDVTRWVHEESWAIGACILCLKDCYPTPPEGVSPTHG